MAATVYAAPDYIKAPSLDIDNLDAYDAACEAYRQQVIEWAKANSPSTSDLVGEVIRFPVADGYAEYVVMNTRPLQLIHLETGDAYAADAMTLRGLRVSDVRSMVKSSRALADMFAGADDWFDGLAVGSTVHYHDGFGEYVRCEIAVGNPDNLRDYAGRVDASLIGKNVLQPVALVGNWKSVSRRDERTGEAHYDSHAEAIIAKRGAWRPSDSCVFEAPGFARTGKVADPTCMDPIDLTPPDLTDEQLAAIPAWQAVDRVRDALAMDATRGKTPQEILDSVRLALAS